MHKQSYKPSEAFIEHRRARMNIALVLLFIDQVRNGAKQLTREHCMQAAAMLPKYRPRTDRERAEALLAQGRCRDCGLEMDRVGGATKRKCRPCADRRAAKSRELNAARMAAGLCYVCARPRSDRSAHCCDACLDRRNGQQGSKRRAIKPSPRPTSPGLDAEIVRIAKEIRRPITSRAMAAELVQAGKFDDGQRYKMRLTERVNQRMWVLASQGELRRVGWARYVARKAG